ncbi:MAG: 4-hydroxythreonine-4-phosphate dehydrogenase PdxA [Candidatus Margulisbacteria bacterium]|nr:4-hydroxythreonine-4-phosphate dehydrogenase PdxA [Candidatus Margulisiibacteriota bacterium]
MTKLKIGITAGDMCGIGPEIIQKVVNLPGIKRLAELYVIGPKYFVEKLKKVRSIAIDNLKAKNLTVGQVNPKAGKAAVEYVEKAIELCLKKELDAMVTAPINKEAVHAAGISFPGHTELLVDRTNTRKYAMAFYSKPLKIMLTTIHVSLRQVPGLLKKEKIIEKIQLANKFIKDLGIKKPRIAVAGLNPHAGEAGRFGQEEQEVIMPAVEEARQAGILVSGPFPGDTIFNRAVNGEFDLVLAHYHDQGLIPLKLLAFDSAVNVTVGLPIIRTSVDHGTAFDIAGKNMANPNSLREAIKLAVLLAKNKKK